MNLVKSFLVAILAILLQSCGSIGDITKRDVAIGVIGVGAVASLMGVCNWIDDDDYDGQYQPIDPTVNPYQSVFSNNYGNDCVDFFLGGSE